MTFCTIPVERLENDDLVAVKLVMNETLYRQYKTLCRIFDIPMNQEMQSVLKSHLETTKEIDYDDYRSDEDFIDRIEIRMHNLDPLEDTE